MTQRRTPERGEKVYLSIPITGMNEQWQRAQAKDTQNLLEMQGIRAVNPFDVGDELRRRMRRKPTHKEYMIEDILAMQQCQYIYLFRGWQNSKGCIEEVEEALRLRLIIIFQKLQ